MLAGKSYFYSSFIQVSTKPPLGCRIITCGAPKVAIGTAIEAKVVLTWNGSNIRLETTACGLAVDMQKVGVQHLPELCCCTTSSCMPTDIYIFHRLTFSISKECHDVEVAELSPHVISVINDLLAVEAAGCTPVRGAATNVFHSFQCLAVGVPVWGVMVDRCVV